MNELRDFCSQYGLEISVIISFNGGANSPDEREGVDDIDFL